MFLIKFITFFLLKMLVSANVFAFWNLVYTSSYVIVHIHAKLVTWMSMSSKRYVVKKKKKKKHITSRNFNARMSLRTSELSQYVLNE